MSIRSSKDFQHVAYNQAADILSEVLIKIPDKAAQKAYYFFKRHFFIMFNKFIVTYLRLALSSILKLFDS